MSFSTSLRVNTRMDDSELKQLLRGSKKEVRKAMELGFRRAMTETKRKTKQYLSQALAPQRIGTSLDHEVINKGRNVEAIFGSQGKDLGGTIGVGIHTSPDDDGNQYNIGAAYQEGRSQRTVYWKAAGAFEHGREIGRSGTGTAWLPSEKFTFFGFPQLDYIGFAMDDFKERSPRIVKRMIDRAYANKGGES